MSFERDPELDEIFSDPELRDLAQRLRSLPPQGVEPDPTFRATLRRRLMGDAWDLMRPKVPWYRRLFDTGSPRRPLVTAPRLAGFAAAVGVCLLAFAAITMYGSQPGTTTQIVATSPLQDAQAVGLRQPIVINFSHSVDPRAVQVRIEPATEIKKDWQGSTLKITPVNGLAANTQYQVTVAPTATKADGQAVAPKKVTFVTTTPPPTALPTPKPRPTPTGTPPLPVINEHQLQQTGPPAARWSGDGKKLYVVGPNGQLQVVPQDGGDTQQLQPDGVTAVAVGPSGPAYVRAGVAVYGDVTVTGTQPVGIGFRSGKLVVATSDGVLAADKTRLANFAEQASAVDFSPDGDRVAYLGASGLHVVGLNSPQDDKLIGPATGLGDWSPDGHRYAYPTDSAVAITDGSTSSKLVSASGVNGVSWSQGDQLLLGSSSSLQMVSADGALQQTIGDGVFTQPVWSPSGSTFSFRRSGSVWVAQVNLSRAPIPAQSVDDAVNGFLAARKAQQPDQAASYLDSSGKSAFANLNLIYGGSPQLSRYYVIFSQPSQAVVRLLLKQDNVETTIVDETLSLVTDQSTGRVLVHGVTEAPARPLGKGPEVLKVSVQANQIRVAFDSDLDPSTAAAGVSLKGSTVTAAYDSSSRTVVLTAPSGLTSGSDYRLVVSSDLQDVNQKPAARFEVAIPSTATG